jgi:ferredoxin
VRLLERVFPGRFVVAKTTNFPLVGCIVDRWLFDGDDLIYLPQDQVVQTVSVDEAIDRPGETVLPSRVVEHFVERASVHWIMDFCLCRAAERCRDYPIDLGCLFLGEAALGINPKLGRRVTKDEALAHVRRCRQEGLVHLVGRNKLDAVWLGVGPGHRLLTVCNCCPCCCLWGVLPYVTPRIGGKIASMPGVKVSVNGRCVGCGACTKGVCFVDGIQLEDGRAVIGDACKACGRCIDVCPQGAIDLSIEDGRFVDDAVAHIAALVDLD